jgi:peptide/nickel transport system substrate-binding protein
MVVVGSIVTAAALAVAGCSATADSGSAGERVLRIAQAGEDAIDFSPLRQDPEISLLSQTIFGSLFGSEEGGTNITPSLAADWSFDDPRTTLSVTLRDDVTFSDGTALDAQDVADTLEWIFGQPEMVPGYEKVDGVEVTGDHSLQIHLNAPDALLLVNLRRVAIVPSEAIADPDSMVTDPVGTGPYVLDREESVEPSTYVFTKRDDAWEADRFPFDQVVFQVVGGEPSASVNALRSGQVDFVQYADSSVGTSLDEDGYEVIPYYWVYFAIWFDTTGNTVPALADVRVRQAISYAFDRQGISDSVNYGYGNPTSQLEANPDGATYREGRDDDYAYDPEKARDLLAEAGYPDGFEMNLVTDIGMAPYEPVIRQSFADIGIKLDYVIVQVEDTIAEFTSGRYSAVISGATAGEIAVSMGAGFPYANPWTGNNPAVLDELVATLNSGSEEEVANASAEMGDFLLDDARGVFFAHPGFLQVANPEAVGFTEYKSWLGQIPLRAFRPAE